MSEVVKESTSDDTKNCNESVEDGEHDPHYDPIISLPEVEVPTLEEDETVMLNMRAKLYRYDTKENPPEWKERGTGTVKILRHKQHNTVRVVMRRDKTLKLCANHFISPYMTLKPNSFCERAWVYSVEDFSDATVKSELLAIKFASIDNAHKWQEVFEDAKKIVANNKNSKVDAKVSVDDKIISEDSAKLSDTFEDEKKSTSDSKEESESQLLKKSSNEVAEKLSSMTIKSTEDAS